MTDYDIDAIQNTAREQATDDPMFFGVDAYGYGHCWSLYDHAMIVVAPNLGTKTYDFREIECSTLSEWAEKIEDQRGDWKAGPHIADSEVDAGIKGAIDA